MEQGLTIVQEMAAALGTKITEAFTLAERVHHGEKRKSGEPYILHPINVAKILFDAGADETVICAALLHDTLEYQENAKDIANEIYAEFGDEVLYLVEAVSKDCNIEDKIEQQNAYIQQMQRSLRIDVFAFFIKIADLIHNLSTISSLPAARRERWLYELRYQYLPLFSGSIHLVPLAHRSVFQYLADKVEAMITAYDALPSVGTEGVQ